MVKTVVLFCIPARGHVQRAVLMTRELVAAGAIVHVYSGREYAGEFGRAGGTFHDLFAGRPLDAADDQSVPIPCRHVTFAAVFVDAIVAEVAELSPDVIVYGTFAVVAVLVAVALGVPRVALCAGHNMAPDVALAQIHGDPRVAVSRRCRDAVEMIRKRFGIENASPFSYLDSLSPVLNVIPEPREFLREEDLSPFKPCDFFGSVDPLRFGPEVREQEDGRLRVFASFGTIAHRYYSVTIDSAIRAILDAVRDEPDTECVVGLGGATPERTLRVPPNASLQAYVDQSAVLQTSDVFITHHGLNSTHESIFALTPMVSYPIFADQPGLASRCQELGVAIPLTSNVRGDVDSRSVKDAIARVIGMRDSMRDRLREAKLWELGAVAARPMVAARILALA